MKSQVKQKKQVPKTAKRVTIQEMKSYTKEAVKAYEKTLLRLAHD